jgi:hypothetical protein
VARASAPEIPAPLEGLSLLPRHVRLTRGYGAHSAGRARCGIVRIVKESATPLRTLQATLEVVTYDPVRRKGFMKITDPEIRGVRVHFALSVLPEPFKGSIVVRSRPLNYHRDMSEEAFKEHMREIKRMLVGAQFRATLVEGADGRPRIAKRTISQLPMADADRARPFRDGEARERPPGVTPSLTRAGR